MELSAVLKRIFPRCDVFPDAGGAFSVIGLVKGTQPTGCEILLRSSAPAPRDYRREYFLVRAEEAMLFFRICTSSQWAGNEEFVVGEGVSIGAEDQQRLEAFARERVAAHCTPAAAPPDRLPAHA